MTILRLTYETPSFNRTIVELKLSHGKRPEQANRLLIEPLWN